MSLVKDPRLRQIAKQICRDLRKNQTKAELTFWDAVRNRKILGYKFYRQYPLFFDYMGKETFFVADFFCFEKRLVIELNGKIHNYQLGRDRLREYLIYMLGIEVVRYRNDEIENNLDMVLERLKFKLR